jgi:cell division protein FtsL
MSAPARHLTPPPARRRGERDGSRGAGTRERPKGVHGTQRPLRSETRRVTGPRRKRRHHIAFAVLASALVGSMVFGIVVLNVLLAQASFRIDEAERRIGALSADHVELVQEEATLSAPGRIAHWASRHDMRLPDDIRILHASGRTGVDPAGAGTPSNGTGGTKATSP